MHDVISAFLDNEPFDPRALADALATEDGREMLLDTIALRALVQVPDAPVAAAPRSDLKNSWRGWALAAAAVLVAAVAGYGAGRQEEPLHAPVPEATSVFTFEPGVNWTETPTEGGN
jgi:hypothetical protein